MSKREVYTSQKLFNGDNATIYSIKGRDFFNANLKAGREDHMPVMPYYLICEVAIIDDKKVSLEYLMDLSIDDILLLLEAISIQLTPLKL